MRQLLAEAIRVASAAAVRLPIAGVTDGALSSDGRLAAVVDKDGILTLHEAESGQLLETLSDTEPDDQTDPAESVVFLRDGKHLLSVHKPDETQYTIRLWRQPQPGAPFENEYKIDCPDVGSGSIERLMLAPDEHYLLMHADGSWEGASWSELVLYDLTTGNPVRDSVERGVPHGQGSELSAAAAALCRDGSRILIIDSAMELRSDPSTEESSQEPSDLTAVKIIDTASGKLIGKISESGTGIVQAQLSPDMQRLLTLNRRGEGKVWQVDSGKRLFALDLQKTQTASSSFRPDWVEARSRVFKLTSRGGLELHDKLRGKIDLKAARADRAQYVADGSLIAVSMITGELIHWDARTGVCRSTRCGADSSTADEFGSAVAPILIFQRDRTYQADHHEVVCPARAQPAARYLNRAQLPRLNMRPGEVTQIIRSAGASAQTLRAAASPWQSARTSCRRRLPQALGQGLAAMTRRGFPLPLSSHDRSSPGRDPGQLDRRQRDYAAVEPMQLLHGALGRQVRSSTRTCSVSRCRYFVAFL